MKRAKERTKLLRHWWRRLSPLDQKLRLLCLMSPLVSWGPTFRLPVFAWRRSRLYTRLCPPTPSPFISGCATCGQEIRADTAWDELMVKFHEHARQAKHAAFVTPDDDGSIASRLHRALQAGAGGGGFPMRVLYAQAQAMAGRSSGESPSRLPEQAEKTSACAPVRLHPRVFEKYMKPFLPKEWREPGRVVGIGGFDLWLIFDEKGEPVVAGPPVDFWLPSVQHILSQTMKAAVEALVWVQTDDPTHKLTADDLEELRRIRVPHLLLARLAALPKPIDLSGPEADAAPLLFHATLLSAGRVLLEIREWAREFQTHQSQRQKMILREKRALRSYLQRSRTLHLPADVWEGLKTDIEWRVASLDQLSRPSSKRVQKQRRRLHVYRRQPSTEAFWTDLIHWAVEELKQQDGMPERDACQAVQVMLNAAFPDVRKWTLDAVKSRYYHAL